MLLKAKQRQQVSAGGGITSNSLQFRIKQGPVILLLFFLQIQIIKIINQFDREAVECGSIQRLF